MDIKKKMLRNCIPAMICMLLNGIYTVIDGFFIGQSVGEVGLAAINLVWPVPAVITAAGTAIGTGGGICISLEKGRQNGKEEKIIFQIIWVLFGIAALFLTMILWAGMKPILSLLGAEGEVGMLAADYGVVIAAFAAIQILGSGILPLLRNMGKPVIAMCCMTCGLLGNICLNYYFIVVQKMGIKGAAWGTVGAQTIVTSLGLIILFGRKGSKSRKNKKEEGSPVEKDALLLESPIRWGKRILKNGGAVFGISLLPTWTLALTNYQCMQFGGTGAVAVYAVISYLVFPVQNILVGIGDGIQPLVSFYEGKRETQTIHRVIRMSGVSIMAVGMLFLCLIFILASFFGNWFGLSPEHMPDYLWGIRAAAMSFLPYGLSRLLITCMNGRGQIKYAAVLIYGEALIIAPVFLLALPAALGIKGIWLEPLIDAVVCLISAFVIEILVLK